jgi:hypothetical protein
MFLRKYNEILQVQIVTRRGMIIATQLDECRCQLCADNVISIAIPGRRAAAHCKKNTFNCHPLTYENSPFQ